MNLLNRMNLSRRLLLLVGAAVAAVVVLSLGLLWTERNQMLDERRQAVRQHVEIAHALVQHLQAQVGNGLSEADAKAAALAALKALRYNGQEYFWVNDMTPRMVMHAARRQLDGKDLSDTKDPTGKRVFVEFVQAARQPEGGYVDYLWPKPGQDQPVPKVSYVKAFEPWGWVIGTGVYVDTVDAAMLRRAASSAVGALLAGALLVGLGLLIRRSLLNELGGEPSQAVDITRQIAAGDLTGHIPLKAGDQHSLMASLSRMRNDLGRLVSGVRQGAESVATASAEIAYGNQDLSQRTEQQAGSLQQASSTMEELGATVHSNAEQARSADDRARAAADIAERGGVAVREVVDTMDRIHQSARRIADIISTIDGIAFQTNILALNAAVEAARAGEQGRGFAVVAGEVRNLAQRSAEAAREIKQLIEASTSQVDEGSHRVNQAGDTIEQVVQAVKQVSEIISGISTASQAQNAGVRQMGGVVTELDRGTQQNAALVEQSAAAAESLRRHAQQLVEQVSVFRTTAQ
ncbi:methyl-accepting chemotaxis protein [Aquincola tertiaricarbonis]|uniref:Methyl-accepting chemotaxis protein n=1 Tax=Aquincola tertiaricarbonis TaxID=391953 RepID=A0ABY4SGP1_AQUTE|nr:methyl-accepting chemotaxis protein [Aquincola tertiaricarbonis]URI11297.1 methyl-accepting chemotaxis protein [Aquincola tertiaricarbonis]